MNTLTNNNFKNALKSLEVHTEVGMIKITDEHGEVATFNTNTTDHNIEDEILIFGNDYQITDVQKDMLYDMLMIAHKEYLNQDNSAFTQEDYAHFTNLIYS